MPSWKGQGADWNAEVGCPGCVGTGVAVASVVLRCLGRFETPAITAASSTITVRTTPAMTMLLGLLRLGAGGMGCPEPDCCVGQYAPFRGSAGGGVSPGLWEKAGES